jgi:hypothetical protein
MADIMKKTHTQISKYMASDGHEVSAGAETVMIFSTAHLSATYYDYVDHT